MNDSLIQQSRFAERLRSVSPEPGDNVLRHLLFQYCKLYQEDYCFVQLVDAFSYVEMTLAATAEEKRILNAELPRVREEVEFAMGGILH